MFLRNVGLYGVIFQKITLGNNHKVNTSIKPRFNELLWSILENQLISYVAAWKQLHLNHWFAKTRCKCSWKRWLLHAT
jgi:hypothetical protein